MRRRVISCSAPWAAAGTETRSSARTVRMVIPGPVWELRRYDRPIEPPSCAEVRVALPADRLSRVLTVEPDLQRLEVLQDRGRIESLLPREAQHRFLPGPARSRLEYLRELPARVLASIERALVERPCLASRLAHRAVELELVDTRQEIPRVRYVARHMVLRARIEILFGALNGGHDALV